MGNGVSPGSSPGFTLHNFCSGFGVNGKIAEPQKDTQSNEDWVRRGLRVPPSLHSSPAGAHSGRRRDGGRSLVPSCTVGLECL